jgi:type VI secretion system protein ImpL
MAENFQRASQIREAFFPQGSAGFSFAIRTVSIGDGLDSARIEINTGVLQFDRTASYSGFNNQSPASPPPTVLFQWPGPIGLGGATLTLQPTGRGETPSTLTKGGPWALFRMLDVAKLTRVGDAVIARFGTGEQEAVYQINITTLPNPLLLQALRDFRCPTAAP